MVFSQGQMMPAVGANQFFLVSKQILARKANRWKEKFKNTSAHGGNAMVAKNKISKFIEMKQVLFVFCQKLAVFIHCQST